MHTSGARARARASVHNLFRGLVTSISETITHQYKQIMQQLTCREDRRGGGGGGGKREGGGEHEEEIIRGFGNRL